MSRRARELDALLDGTAVDDTPLDELMSALQAPDEPDELAGLSAAMTAFFRIGPAARPASFRPAPVSHRRPAAFGRSLVLRLAAAFAGASVIGGVALAAYVSHGHHSPAPSTHPGVGSSRSIGSSTPVGGGPVVGRSTDAAPSTTTAPTSRKPTASSSVPGAGGVASGPTSSTQPTHPSHTKHSPSGKPTTAASASQTHPGNSGHTKHPHPPHPSKP